MTKSMNELVKKSMTGNHVARGALKLKVRNAINTGIEIAGAKVVYNNTWPIHTYVESIKQNIVHKTNTISSSFIAQRIADEGLWSGVLDGASIKAKGKNSKDPVGARIIQNDTDAIRYVNKNGISNRNIDKVYDILALGFDLNKKEVSEDKRILIKKMFAYKSSNEILDACIKYALTILIMPYEHSNVTLGRVIMWHELVKYDSVFKYMRLSHNIFSTNYIHHSVIQNMLICTDIDGKKYHDITPFLEYMLWTIAKVTCEVSKLTLNECVQEHCLWVAKTDSCVPKNRFYTDKYTKQAVNNALNALVKKQELRKIKTSTEEYYTVV